MIAGDGVSVDGSGLTNPNVRPGTYYLALLLMDDSGKVYQRADLSGTYTKTATPNTPPPNNPPPNNPPPGSSEGGGGGAISAMAMLLLGLLALARSALIRQLARRTGIVSITRPSRGCYFRE